jgi:hypothetical protein
MQGMLGIGLILVVNNVIWAILFWRLGNTMLEVGKLLASKTMGEYSWLKKAEKGNPAKETDGYEKVWEEEENG